jgi:hypothetical protein
VADLGRDALPRGVDRQLAVGGAKGVRLAH